MGVAFILAFVLVGLAELGDKSQLLLLGFAAKYRPAKVLAGAAVAILLLQAASVLLGRAVGTFVPGGIVSVAAGLLFIIFGIVTWRGADDEGSGEADGRTFTLGPILTVAAALLLAEFGDKTQLMTVSIAADPAAALRTLGSVASGIKAPEAGSTATALGVWLGSSAGFLAADALAIVIGAVLGARLPRRAIARFSAVVFVVFGSVTLASTFVV